MMYNGQMVYYTVRGKYKKLSGEDYEGSFVQTPAGILRTPQGDTIVPVDSKQLVESQPTTTPSLNTTLNENDTQYDLLPVRINNPPVIVRPMTEASNPTVKPSSVAGKLEGTYMYQFPDGNVKVHAGTTITLGVDAEQPNVLNVENGRLVIIPSDQDLTYQWTVDGEPVPQFEGDTSLRATREVQGNRLIITNMIPQYAGTYNCVVSNDIGSTDGGSITLEVYNSDVDSLLYTNLVANPNGLDEEGRPSTAGWQSVLGSIEVKNLKKPIGERDKSIVVDPFNERFEWTREMLFPRPYQLDGGILQNDPTTNIQTYLTRQKYQYATNNGLPTVQVYQDIDLTDLKQHIEGSIYGVSGLSAVVSCYLGMAIYNYEVTDRYITPDLRANIGNYYQGAARLSLENFVRMGPGFVKERAYVDIEEYYNEKRVASIYDGAIQPNPIRLVDPWNKRLERYRNQSYYQGGRNILFPEDGPSIGDNRDRHLFVADELFPTQEDRNTYGQYAEFNKIIIDKLNPKTNKIRIVYTIDALDDMWYTMYDRDRFFTNTIFDGLLEGPGWAGSWKTDSADPKEIDPTITRQPFTVIRANYKTNEQDIEQRIPKASNSKAFATAFNVSLIPIEEGRDNRQVADNLYTINTRVSALVPSPIQKLPPYIGGDIGLRDLDIEFIMEANNVVGIQMMSTIPNLPHTGIQQEDFTPGLFPFNGEQTLFGLFDKQKNTELQVIKSINQTKSPIKDISTSILRSTITQANLTSTPFYTYNTTSTIPTTPPYVVLNNTGVDEGSPFTGLPITPLQLPAQWFTILPQDRLNITTKDTALDEAEFDQLRKLYGRWAIPHNPLNMTTYLQLLNENSNTGLRSVLLDNITSQPQQAQWKRATRFIITLGVHNTSLSTQNANYLHAIDNYYMDIVDNEVVIHKTPITGVPNNPSLETPLASFDRHEEAVGSQLRRTLEYVDDAVLQEGKLYIRPQLTMKPYVIPINVVTGESDKIATFELPNQLLTANREDGGLNIPTIQPTTQIREVVQTSLELYTNAQTINTERALFNLQSIEAVLDEQIQQELLQLNTPEQQFFNNYNYDIPHNSGDQQFADTPLDFNSIIMVLGRRKNALVELYRDQTSLPQIVLSELSIQQTQAEMFNTYDDEPTDTDFKVIIYGIRPTQASAAITNYDNIDNPSQVQQDTLLIGTPLAGQDVNTSRTFTVRNIKVRNNTLNDTN